MPEETERARRKRARFHELMQRERQLWGSGYTRVAGVDEAGVGPLAGPVVAAAVVFRPGQGVLGVDDSKKISPSVRDRLAESIRRDSACYSVASLEPAEIDAMNIYQAGLEAMRRAVSGLDLEPDYLLVDARKVPGVAIVQEAILKGDATCQVIGAASILAKTARDRLMREYDERYPGYGFAGHKGYPTVAHRDAIRRLGPSPIHRRSFTLLPRPKLRDDA